MKKVSITMSKVNKNPFERKQEGAVVKLCIVLMIAGSLSSCAVKADNVEGDENSPIYVWTKGQKYYYAFDEKIFLDIVPNMVVLSFEEKYLAEIQKFLQEDTQIRNMELANLGKCYILTTTEKSNVKVLMNDLKKLPGVKSVNPIYATSEGALIPMTGDIVVKFKENVSQHKIDEIFQKYRLVVIDISSWSSYYLSVPIDIDPLEVANAIYVSGLTSYSYPNFLMTAVNHN